MLEEWFGFGGGGNPEASEISPTYPRIRTDRNCHNHVTTEARLNLTFVLVQIIDAVGDLRRAIPTADDGPDMDALSLAGEYHVTPT